jgi:uncharacterized repeat protein (TIGR03803 family)
MKRILPVVLIIILAVSLASKATAADKFETLFDFTLRSDGCYPEGQLIYDSSGNLYGTTNQCGVGNGAWGTVFELTPNGSGGWTESVLYTFTGDDGEGPTGPLTLDSAGNIYGTLSLAGEANGGEVYELVPNGEGGWGELSLYAFCSLSKCADGSTPYSGVIFDQQGNLYGTTADGGGVENDTCPLGCGTVFKLTPNGRGGWTESVIYSFKGKGDGAGPAGLIFDQAGSLYGTAGAGGRPFGGGTVFKLSPNENGSWTFTTLYKFCRLEYCRDGEGPAAGVIFDSAGNLYGTTRGGGAHGNYQDGVVFELSPTASGPWNEKVIHQFTGGDDGASPYAGVTFDSAGNLYGATIQGGSDNCYFGCGAVFKLVRGSNGVWHEATIHDFGGYSSSNPKAGLVFNGSVLYGPASSASEGHGYGIVFEVIP